MVEDVQITLSGSRPVEFLGYTGGDAPSVKELVVLGRKLLQKPRRRAASPRLRAMIAIEMLA